MVSMENVFVLPGIEGRLVFQTIANRDLVVVRGDAAGGVVVIVNFVVDVLYAVVDPRLLHDARADS